MQADTRLIKNIKHIHQLGTYLCSQADTLALPAGKADRATVQSQIIQTDIQQELQTCTNLFQNLY